MALKLCESTIIFALPKLIDIFRRSHVCVLLQEPFQEKKILKKRNALHKNLAPTNFFAILSILKQGAI